MSLADYYAYDFDIWPLTFIHTYRSMDAIVDALEQHDTPFIKRLETPASRLAARAAALPIYYHLATAGYGAAVDNQLVGWVYLRGWYQVLYIETLAVAPDWRGQGIGTDLLSFTEALAVRMNREWLGLTVTVDNQSAFDLYDTAGFERGHWRIMQRSADPPLPPPQMDDLRLIPLVGRAARQAHRRFAEKDLSAGDAADRVTLTRFLTNDIYHQPGLHWRVVYRGQPIAYLNRSRSALNVLTLYVAAGPDWWGSDPLLSAIRRALTTLTGERISRIDLRLGSSSHHETAREALSGLGFDEQPASRARMYKHLQRG